MARYTRRWVVQAYENGKWVTVRSFATRREAGAWLKLAGNENGKNYRIVEISV